MAPMRLCPDVAAAQMWEGPTAPIDMSLVLAAGRPLPHAMANSGSGPWPRWVFAQIWEWPMAPMGLCPDVAAAYGPDGFVSRCGRGPTGPMDISFALAAGRPLPHAMANFGSDLRPRWVCAQMWQRPMAPIDMSLGLAASRPPPLGICAGYQVLGATGSTGAPAFFQAPKPPSIWHTGVKPMSCAVLVASAERRPPAQKNTNLLPELKNSL